MDIEKYKGALAREGVVILNRLLKKRPLSTFHFIEGEKGNASKPR